MNKNEKKLKVMFVITKSNWGGAQRYVYDLATTFANNKTYDVVVACGGEGELVKRLTESGVRVISIPRLERDVRVFAELSVLKTLYQIFRVERPDVVHLNSSKIGGIGSLAGRLARVPRIIYTAHGWAFNEPRPFFARWVIQAASYLTLLFSHVTIVIAQKEHEQVRSWPIVGKRVVRIPLGVSPFELLPRKEARQILAGACSAEKTFSEDTLLIGAIAELHPNKGIPYAIQALLKERSLETQPYKLVVIGDGELREKLAHLAEESGVSEKVCFAGYMSNAAQYLSAFDIALLPSVKEGLPYFLLEAAHAKLPVIATRVGGVPELLAEEEMGELVDPRDPDAISRSLVRFLESAEIRKNTGKRFSDHVEHTFSFEAMVSETEKVYAGQPLRYRSPYFDSVPE